MEISHIMLRGLFVDPKVRAQKRHVDSENIKLKIGSRGLLFSKGDLNS
jgi:hypothetical protein